jgi:hypothetical protein
MSMKKLLTTLFLAVLSQQTLAATTTVVGIDFLDTANSVAASTGSFASNDPTQLTKVNSAVDGNAAAYTWGLSDPSTLDVMLGSGGANVADVNLTLLFVGSNPHTGTVSLFGGSGGTSSSYEYSLTPYRQGLTPAEDIWTGYTGYNSVESVEENGEPTTTTLGIFALTINLAQAFPTFNGTFNGVSLNIYDLDSSTGAVLYDSGLSLVGTTAVPVPAAVWLFGSGLVGLAGIARKRA